MAWWRLILPVALTIALIIAMIGCIPIPATRQLQPDNTLRPEHAVGKAGSHNPVRLDETRIEDAFIELSKRVRVTAHDIGWYTNMRSEIPAQWSIWQWSVSADRREFAIAYQVRRRSRLFPLCFYAQGVFDDRWLLLRIDESGILRETQTLAAPPQWPAVAPAEWLRIFTNAQREKLRAAGVFPPDEWLMESERNLAERRAARVAQEAADARRRKAATQRQ